MTVANQALTVRSSRYGYIDGEFCLEYTIPRNSDILHDFYIDCLPGWLTTLTHCEMLFGDVIVDIAISTNNWANIIPYPLMTKDGEKLQFPHCASQYSLIRVKLYSNAPIETGKNLIVISTILGDDRTDYIKNANSNNIEFFYQNSHKLLDSFILKDGGVCKAMQTKETISLLHNISGDANLEYRFNISSPGSLLKRCTLVTTDLDNVTSVTLNYNASITLAGKILPTGEVIFNLNKLDMIIPRYQEVVITVVLKTVDCKLAVKVGLEYFDCKSTFDTNKLVTVDNNILDYQYMNGIVEVS